MARDNIEFNFESEEYCSECDSYFFTNILFTDCPNCESEVVACNACDNKKCQDCSRGSNFNLQKIPGEASDWDN